MNEQVRIPYTFITPLEPQSVPSNGALSGLDALRDEWERRLRELTDADRNRIRQRSLRKLAIETGIIERLYDIEWGLTLNLISEGFARDVLERHGGTLDDRTRATLEAQRESLEMVLDFVRSDRPLSVGFIQELHAAMTRTQTTYLATDVLGRVVDVPLEHGKWKSQPNHVQRGDGRVLEYAPPEHVGSEMDRLVALYAAAENSLAHPMIIAAWLHHRFVQIHPFADGNGRVARALVLLVAQKHRFAPLVVDRFHRDKYLHALDAANEGDLSLLVRLFTNLAGASLTSELETPVEATLSTSTQVAHTLADQLQALNQANESMLLNALQPRQLQVAAQVQSWFAGKSAELESLFRARSLNNVRVLKDHQMGPSASHGFWFRDQIVTAAHRVGYYADFNRLSGWSGVRLRVGEVTLRFVAALHGAGKRSGVLAVVTFAEIETRSQMEDGDLRRERAFVETTADAFRVVHTESTESINERLHDLADLLDEGLAIALAEFMEKVA